MKIPKKYQNKISSIEAEGGLIDDCKYMVYLLEGYEHPIFGDSFPIVGGKELAEFMEEVEAVK